MFYNFSLEWLTKGEDKYESASEINAAGNLPRLDIFPNPTDDIISLKSEDLIKINIYNIQGQLLTSLNVDAKMVSIDMTDYNEGIYLIEGVDEKFNKKVSKVVVK